MTRLWKTLSFLKNGAMVLNLPFDLGEFRPASSCPAGKLAVLRPPSFPPARAKIAREKGDLGG